MTRIIDVEPETLHRWGRRGVAAVTLFAAAAVGWRVFHTPEGRGAVPARMDAALSDEGRDARPARTDVASSIEGRPAVAARTSVGGASGPDPAVSAAPSPAGAPTVAPRTAPPSPPSKPVTKEAQTAALRSAVLQDTIQTLRLAAARGDEATVKGLSAGLKYQRKEALKLLNEAMHREDDAAVRMTLQQVMGNIDSAD